MSKKAVDRAEVKVVNVRLVKEPSLYSAEPIHSPEDVLRGIAGELAQYDREVLPFSISRATGS